MAVKHIRRRQPPADAPPLADRLHPLLARVYHNRGVRDPEELSLELARLTAPTELAGIEVAAGLLADAVMTGERVLIIGDVDADGAASSALGVPALRAMGGEGGVPQPERLDRALGLAASVVQAAATLAS